jgi:hypothetical protein
MSSANTAAIRAAAGFSTRNESSLHRALKCRYSGEDGQTESVLEGYVCDAIRSDGEIIEVQTGHFKDIEKKVASLVRLRPVRLIYPVIVEKTIVLLSGDGELVSRRRSPRKGSVYELFAELVYTPELPLLQGLTIEVACIDAIENRRDDGRGSYHRKGVSIGDRELTLFRESIRLSSPGDYRRFIPQGLPTEGFTVKQFRAACKIRPRLASQCIAVLRRIGLVEYVGKQDRAYVYRVVGSIPPALSQPVG